MIELLNKKHHRNYFDCGKTLLNTYIKNQAGQDRKKSIPMFCVRRKGDRQH